MAKQKYKCLGAKLLWNADRKIKGYIYYVLNGLPQLFQLTKLEDLNTEHNSRLSRFFESDYYYVLWEHTESLYYSTKEQTIKTINEMGHPTDVDSNPHDITIIGKDFENSDILAFDHDDNIYFYEKCGRIEVHLD